MFSCTCRVRYFIWWSHYRSMIFISVGRGGPATSVTGYRLDSPMWAGYIKKYSEGGLMSGAGEESAASNTFNALCAHPAVFELQRASGLQKKQNTVHSTNFKVAWFHTSTPLRFKWDSCFSMVNIWIMYHYQHFIFKVFSHTCWQEMTCDWNTVEISAVISKLMKYILQSSFTLRCKGSNFIQ